EPSIGEERPIDRDDPLGGPVYAAGREFPAEMRRLPLGPRLRALLDEQLRWVLAHSYWVSGGTSSAWRVADRAEGRDLPDMRMWLSAETLPLLAADLGKVFRLLGHPIGEEPALDLAVRLVVWHELGHVLLDVYDVTRYDL